jgi:hypothetical protein
VVALLAQAVTCTWGSHLDDFPIDKFRALFESDNTGFADPVIFVHSESPFFDFDTHEALSKGMYLAITALARHETFPGVYRALPYGLTVKQAVGDGEVGRLRD